MPPPTLTNVSTTPISYTNWTDNSAGALAVVATASSIKVTHNTAVLGVYKSITVNLASAVDLSDKYIYLVTTFSSRTTGARYRFLDVNGNYKEYYDIVNRYGVLTHIFDLASTPDASSGTLNTAAITNIMISVAAQQASTNCEVTLGQMFVCDYMAIVGGDSTTPITVKAIYDLIYATWPTNHQIGANGNNNLPPTARARAAATIPHRLKIGNNNAAHFDNGDTGGIFMPDSSVGAFASGWDMNLTGTGGWPSNLFAFSGQWLTDAYRVLTFDTTTTQTVSGLQIIGWSYVNSSSGIITHASWSISAGPTQNINFGTGPVIGCSIFGGGNVTIGADSSGNTFQETDTVTVSGGFDLTTSVIRGTLASASEAAVSVSADGTMLDGTTIDVTGTSAGYHLELGASVTSITLTDVTFTGTPGTDKVRVLRTTGTVTITLSGSTTLSAGDVTTAGATVTIVSGADVTLTGLVAGSEVRAFVGTPDSATLLASTESSGTSFTFSQSQAGNAGFIAVRNLNYKFIRLNLTYSGSNQSIPVQQQFDRDYINP